MSLQESDFPGLYQDADTNSLEAQQRYLRFLQLGLIALIVAAIAGASSVTVGPADLGGVIATMAFVVAILTRVLLLKEHPERIWYDGRAAAESAKTSAWRYAVGGKPFDKNLKDSEAEELFATRLREITEGLNPDSYAPTSNTSLPNITERMKALRSKSFVDRKTEYQEGRIKDQRNWYSRKSTSNRRRAKQWNITLLVVESLGVGAGIFKATGLLDISLLGIAAALAAAGGSWLQAKQHSSLVEAYSVAEKELARIETLLPSYTKEKDWAEFVDEAEEAISREHTLWIASRSSSRTVAALRRGYKGLRP